MSGVPFQTHAFRILRGIKWNSPPLLNIWATRENVFCFSMYGQHDTRLSDVIGDVVAAQPRRQKTEDMVDVFVGVARAEVVQCNRSKGPALTKKRTKFHVLFLLSLVVLSA